MKRALICLEQLGIGGVETFAITQIEEFVRRGIKCYVLARDGLLSERLKDKRNIKYIEYDFVLKNEIDFDKVKEVEKIIKKYKIDFIYVHQFPCMLYILPCAFKLHVPYVAYLHNVVPGTLEWFMSHYSVFQSLFPIYFENASKIIAITKQVKAEHQELFHLPDEKYMVAKNSLNFSKYPDIEIPKIPKKFKKLLLFGRVSELKRNSILAAIDFYNWCRENYNDKMQLTVVGDGEILDEMKETYKDTDILFKGAVSDMKPEIDKADILLGVDRCMLEAVASKKPAIICGYNKNVSLITREKLETCIEENFGGYSLEDDKEEIFRYDIEQLKVSIEECYQYIKKELSISNSIFLDIEPFPNKFDIEYYFRDLNRVGKDWDRLQELNWLIREENEFITDEVDSMNQKQQSKWTYKSLKYMKKVKRAIGRRIRWIIKKDQEQK